MNLQPIKQEVRKREKQRREEKIKKQQRADHKSDENRDDIIKQYGKSQPGKLMYDELKQLLTDEAGGKAIRDTDVNYYLKRFGKPNEESITYFLPTMLERKVVLVPQGGSRYRVENAELLSKRASLGYYQSKDLNMKFDGFLGPESGDIVEGTDDGDGWVQVPLFLDVITKKELRSLLNAFSKYASVMDTTAKILAKYDTTNKGALSRDEVRQLMVDSNHGDLVTDTEVNRVMAHGDMSHTRQIEAPEVHEAVAWWDKQVLNKKKVFVCVQQ